MNCPYVENMDGFAVLDTEEKLQWYMNHLLHREVDLYYVSAKIENMHTVSLIPRRSLLQQTANYREWDIPTIIEPQCYGTVCSDVVSVLRAVHARRRAEDEAKRKEADNGNG